MGPDKYIKNYIDGALVPATSGNYLDNLNPSIGKVYSSLADSDRVDVERAVEAAERAFPAWSSADVQKRFRIMLRIADIIEQNLDSFARAETIDSGKPISMSSSVDIPRGHDNFRYFATSMLHFLSQSHYTPKDSVNFTLRRPLGVVGCIAPWNLPLYLLTWKIAPALIAGNCVVAKPSQLTPMTAYMLSKACMEAGLPAGVLNILHGTSERVNLAMVNHPKIRAISFSGNTEAGNELLEHADLGAKKLSLNLGGKNPNIIFADCDFDQMMIGTLRSSFSNNGQMAHAGSRIYVERPLYERFRDELIKRTQFLKVGDPFSAVSDLGSIISKDHLEKILSYVSLAEVEGGTILCGGKAIEVAGDFEQGFFMRPAVIEGLPIICRTNQEEIFGPIVTLTPFDTEEEVVQLANGTDYGLSASIWTKDVGKANRVAEQIDAGIIWVNCWMKQDLRTSYGGLKNSGIGREGGLESLHFFTNPKNICIQY